MPITPFKQPNPWEELDPHRKHAGDPLELLGTLPMNAWSDVEDIVGGLSYLVSQTPAALGAITEDVTKGTHHTQDFINNIPNALGEFGNALSNQYHLAPAWEGGPRVAPTWESLNYLEEHPLYALMDASLIGGIAGKGVQGASKLGLISKTNPLVRPFGEYVKSGEYLNKAVKDSLKVPFEGMPTQDEMNAITDIAPEITNISKPEFAISKTKAPYSENLFDRAIQMGLESKAGQETLGALTSFPILKNVIQPTFQIAADLFDLKPESRLLNKSAADIRQRRIMEQDINFAKETEQLSGRTLLTDALTPQLSKLGYKTPEQQLDVFNKLHYSMNTGTPPTPDLIPAVEALSQNYLLMEKKLMEAGMSPESILEAKSLLKASADNQVPWQDLLTKKGGKKKIELARKQIVGLNDEELFHDISKNITGKAVKLDNRSLADNIINLYTGKITNDIPDFSSVVDSLVSPEVLLEHGIQLPQLVDMGLEDIAKLTNTAKGVLESSLNYVKQNGLDQFRAKMPQTANIFNDGGALADTIGFKNLQYFAGLAKDNKVVLAPKMFTNSKNRITADYVMSLLMKEANTNKSILEKMTSKGGKLKSNEAILDQLEKGAYGKQMITDIGEATMAYNKQLADRQYADKLLRETTDQFGKKTNAYKFNEKTRLIEFENPIYQDLVSKQGWKIIAPDFAKVFNDEMFSMSDKLNKRRMNMSMDEAIDQVMAENVNNKSLSNAIRNMLTVRNSKPTLYLIPSHIDKELKSIYSVAGTKYDKLVNSYDIMTNMFKTGVLGLSPKWFMNSRLGNFVMNNVKGVTPYYYMKAMKYMDQIPEQIKIHSRAIQGLDRTTNVPDTMGKVYRKMIGARDEELKGFAKLMSIPPSIIDEIAGAMFKANDGMERIERTAGFIKGLEDYEKFNIKQTGGMLLSVPELFKKAQLPENTEMMKFAINFSNKALGDYVNLSKYERRVLRRIIPFYTWTRTILRHTAELPTSNPIVSQLTANITKLQQDLIEDEAKSKSDFQKYSANVNAVDPQTGLPLMFNLMHGLPYSTIQELIDNPLNQLNPLIKIPVEGLSGRKMYTDKYLSSPDYIEYNRRLFDRKTGEPVNKLDIGTRLKYIPTSILRDVVPGTRQVEDIVSLLGSGNIPNKRYDTSLFGGISDQYNRGTAINILNKYVTPGVFENWQPPQKQDLIDRQMKAIMRKTGQQTRSM